MWSGAKVCESCRARKMLKNAYLDAKIGSDTAENEPQEVFSPALASRLAGAEPGDAPLFRGAFAALFRRLVLGWIEADFRVQIRIFQHFSNSIKFYKKIIFSRANLAKIWQKFAKICKIFDSFLKILQNFAKFSEIRKKFAKICRIFGRILQKCVDFEKC